jgi:hypothetical protein
MVCWSLCLCARRVGPCVREDQIVFFEHTLTGHDDDWHVFFQSVCRSLSLLLSGNDRPGPQAGGTQWNLRQCAWMGDSSHRLCPDALHHTLGQIDFAHMMGGPEFVNETESERLIIPPRCRRLVYVCALPDLLHQGTGCKPHADGRPTDSGVCDHWSANRNEKWSALRSGIRYKWRIIEF